MSLLSSPVQHATILRRGAEGNAHPKVVVWRRTFGGGTRCSRWLAGTLSPLDRIMLCNLPHHKSVTLQSSECPVVAKDKGPQKECGTGVCKPGEKECPCHE